MRPYQPGDEVRTIDWNVTARLGEPYVKVFTEEREKERDESLAEVERLMITNNDCNRAIDWAKNEMNKLRDVIRQVHALAAIEEQDYRCVRVVENIREIRKLTKEEP